MNTYLFSPCSSPSVADLRATWEKDVLGPSSVEVEVESQFTIFGL
jgi:hypothetical protein